MTHVSVSEAKGGSVINDSVEKEIGSLAWLGYSPPGLGFRTPEDRSSSVSPENSTHPHQALTLSNALPLGGGGRVVGLEGSSLSQLSPQCSCIYHNSSGTIFTKPPTRCPDSSLS